VPRAAAQVELNTTDRSKYHAERKPTTNFATCSQTIMSSERDSLLVTPSQHPANEQDLEEAGKPKKLGPLEIPRSNRWAILGGIWIANFLGVRPIISCLFHFSEGFVTPGFERCVHKLFLLTSLSHFAAFSYPGGNPYVVKSLYLSSLKLRPSDAVDILRIQQIPPS
jgi:hypothetical protein